MPATGPMMRGGFSTYLYPGLNKTYLLAFNEYPEEYTQFLNVDTSTKYQEEDAVAVGFGLVPEKQEGGTFTYDVMEHVNTVLYTHTTYAMGYEVTQELFEDELYGIIRQGSRALATAVKQTTDVLCASVLNNAFSGTYAGVDGKALCAIDHPQKKAGGIVANKPTNDCDFDPTALADATQAMEEWKNDEDLPLMIKPKWVISGPAQRKIIVQTLGSEKEPFVADNEINAIREWELQKMILHYLDDEDAWWVTSPKQNHFMKMFWRIRPVFRNFDDNDTGNAKFVVRFRLSTGFTHWWGVYGSSGG